MKKPLVVAAFCVLLAACADVTGDAIQVNDASFARSEISDLLDAVADEIGADEELVAVLGETPPGTMQTQVSTTVLTIFIQNEALRQQLDAFGLDITEDDVLDAQAAAEPSGSATVDRLFAELNARDTALGEAGGLDPEVLTNLDVSVDPRYGQWIPEQGVVAPNPGPALER